MNNLYNPNELDYNKGLIPDNNNNVYGNVSGDNSTQNSNNNYNNNPNNYNPNVYNNNPNNYNPNVYNNNPNNYNPNIYNNNSNNYNPNVYNNNPNNYNPNVYNNNPNNYNNNPNNYNPNIYNNNFNKNNDPFTSNNNYPSQPNPTNNSDIKQMNVLSNEIENDKYCCCFYSRDFLREMPRRNISIILILCFCQIILNILLIYVTPDLDIIFHLINSIQFFYIIFSLVSISNNKCIRHFGTIFNVIISSICGLLIFAELFYYIKENIDKFKKHKEFEDAIIYLILFRGGILYILVYIMFDIYCRTFLGRHRDQDGRFTCC